VVGALGESGAAWFANHAVEAPIGNLALLAVAAKDPRGEGIVGILLGLALLLLVARMRGSAVGGLGVSRAVIGGVGGAQHRGIRAFFRDRSGWSTRRSLHYLG